MTQPSGVVAPAASPAPLAVPWLMPRWSLADLVESRRTAWVLLLTGLAQAGLVYAGWPGWPCPLRAALGLPCPGCGLSRAVASLARGDWRIAFASHPFAPLVLVFFALVTVGALAPPRLVGRLASAVRVLEVRTHAPFILATAFLLHGLVRLAVVAVPIVERAFH